MTSALCSTNGSCISPEPNSSPTTFIPTAGVVDDSPAAAGLGHGGVEVASRPFFSPSMIRRCRRSSSGSSMSTSARDFALACARRLSNRSRNAVSGS
jgi:hypothetical protein